MSHARISLLTYADNIIVSHTVRLKELIEAAETQT